MATLYTQQSKNVGKTWLLMSVFLIFVFLFSFNVFAEDSISSNNYPKSADVYVNDYASILSSNKEQIQNELKNFETKTGIQFSVVTVNSIYDYKVGDKNIEDFSRNLFNYWGVGNKEENNGVLMVVAVKDRNVRIQLGSSYDKNYDVIMQGIVDNSIVPLFKAENYSIGVFSGIKEIESSILKGIPWTVKYGRTLIFYGILIALILIGISLIRSGKKGWGWGVIIFIGGILLSVLLRKKNSSNSSFGGGSSSGGGASGKW